MANIVYILGAGASAQAIPVVADSLLRFEFFIVYLENTIYRIQFETGEKRKIVLNRLREYSSILNLCKDHLSFDTLAKKLYLRGDFEQLNTLKEFLCLYYIFEHYRFEDFTNFIDEYIKRIEFVTAEQKKEIADRIIKFQLNHIDFRYDAFVAGISDKRLIERLFIPSNVSILSWNYDLQMEFALNEYDRFGSRNLNYMFNPIDWRQSKIKMDFSQEYIKLNGSAGYLILNEDLIETDTITSTERQAEINLIDLPIKRDEEVYEILFATIINFTNSTNITQYRPYINFAWEENVLSNIVVERAHSKLRSADSVVIIGYSFPTFNREIDERIFKEVDLGRGCKIYIQSINKKEFIKIKTRIQGIANYLDDSYFEFIDDVTQFYVPFEFNKDVEKKEIITSIQLRR